MAIGTRRPEIPNGVEQIVRAEFRKGDHMVHMDEARAHWAISVLETQTANATREPVVIGNASLNWPHLEAL